MVQTVAEVRARVERQKQLVPAMYGGIDFGLRAERFADAGGENSVLKRLPPADRSRLFADTELIARLEAYTMLGDTLADAYAALMPAFGFRRLVDMLVEACDRGVDKVEGAPPELVALIRAMEATPAWVDMAKVERGAALQRNATAHLAPYAVRGAFIATFMNKYAALPMALTGTLSHKTAARRVKETATFFATSVLPGAMERHGPGFKAAAMVRLMHSMVRFNVLSRGRWDQATYGIPIPQVDQMPAGLIGDYLISAKLLKLGRTDFTADERAQIELSRYRCFLLGLPEDLLADTPQGIVDAWMARLGTLRDGFDDATCGALLRATMAAWLEPDTKPWNRVKERYEQSFSKVYFVKNFYDGNVEKAAEVGVPLTATDRARALVVTGLILGRMIGYDLALKLPGLRTVADRRMIRTIRIRLADLGHAEFTTDAAQYRQAPAAAAAV
ncbi:oxygenase MpaB family protein [Sandaracinobacter sp.]|uniref:oxygenase MpaB family protein n=1 Tax=Sandaracinobacter sp. TaxID=2487581 RepID=UPI0035B4F47E